MNLYFADQLRQEQERQGSISGFFTLGNLLMVKVDDNGVSEIVGWYEGDEMVVLGPRPADDPDDDEFVYEDED